MQMGLTEVEDGDTTKSVEAGIISPLQRYARDDSGCGWVDDYSKYFPVVMGDATNVVM